ncbi:MAG: hypothetical protein ABJI22_09735 [Maribacter sp.]
MNKIKYTVLLTILTQSCGVDSEVLEFNTDNAKIELIYPKNNSEVIDGVIISETESELMFEWKKEGDSIGNLYFLTLKNLENNEIITYESSETNISINLNRDVGYSWSVSDTLINNSETWTFVNLGPWDEFSAPLPATAISPVNGASISQTSTTVNIIWKAEDADNDIVSYDLYFGETQNPALLVSEIIDTRYNDISVEAGKIYFWKVVTRDSVGNESTSETFSFSVG